MVQNMHHGVYANLHGVAVGQPLRSPFVARKHLESNSFSAQVPSKSRYLGILNTMTTFNNLKVPFLSMTQLKKNVLEVDGPKSTLEFFIPSKVPCPFLLEALVEDNPTPGKFNQRFQIVLTTNDYTYGDIISPNLRNGKQLRIQLRDPNDERTEIREWGNGYIYTVAMDSYDDEDYFPTEFLEPGTIFVKLDNINGGEFQNGQTAVTGHGRSELQPFTYALGDSSRAIHSWVTSDASHRKYKVDSPSFPSLAHLDGASTDVNNYFTKEDGVIKDVYWVPVLIEQMAAELAKMHDKALTYQQGTAFSTGREKIRVGLGFYQQVKQRGNYDTFSDWDQAFDLILQGAERLFSIHNKVDLDDRVIKIKAGTLAYKELIRRLKTYFQTDNPFTVMADHPALLKANMITYSDTTGILYRPLQFKALFIPEMGLVQIEQDTTLDHLDDDTLEHPRAAGHQSVTSGMIFIEDMSSTDFTNAIPKGVTAGSPSSIRNVSMIRESGKEDGINFRVGGEVSESLKKMLGINNGGTVADWNKTLEIRMWTHGELFVHDPSRCWILEYDPYGDIAFNNRNISLYKPF